MIGAFTATWLKLTRPLLLLATTGATIGFAVMVTVGTFLTAARPGGSRLSDPPMLLSTMNGATVPGDLISRMVMVLGAVILTACAAHVAGEYRTGTLSIQLVRQPDGERRAHGAAACR
jgi:hypothetical protein